MLRTAIESMIAMRLKHGAQWARSFNSAPQVLADMRRRGLIESATPPGGQGANMVRLTDAGRIHFFKDNYAATRQRKKAEAACLIDDFAELLAEGWSVPAAARKLGRSQQTGSNWLRQIREGLGAQAV